MIKGTTSLKGGGGGGGGAGLDPGGRPHQPENPNETGAKFLNSKDAKCLKL